MQSGYFKGTISGTRNDGQPLNESFDFEYKWVSALESFYPVNGANYLKYITRTTSAGNGPQLEIYDIKSSNGGLQTDPGRTFVYFYYTRELSPSSVLEVQVSPYFEKDIPATISEISSVNNQPYQFSQGSNPNNTTSGAINYSVVTLDVGNAYHFFASHYSIYYAASNGALLMIYDITTNATITSGDVFDTYNALIFKNNATLGIPVFYDGATNTALSGTTPAVPADVLTVTNYKQDANSGVIAFDFTVKISQYRGASPFGGANSTNHDLTISGSFNSGSKVYQNTINRIAAGH
jgi:hypothetical protein